MQWLATSNKEQTRFFTRRQVGDCTDKVSILGWNRNKNGLFDDVAFQYRPILLELLHCNSTVTYRELSNRAQEKLSEKPPRDALIRLLKVPLIQYMM